MPNILGFLFKQKEDKLNFAFLITLICFMIYAIFLITYDIIKFLQLYQNGVISADNFVFFNVAGIVFAVFEFGFFVYKLFKDKKQIRSK